MPHGQQRAPVLTGARHHGQQPPATGLPGPLRPGPAPSGPRPSGARRPGTALPAARWVCQPIVFSPLEAGLACRAAREFTGRILRGWGLLAVADDAALVVSELVTNALRHGVGERCEVAGQVELIWWRRAGQLVCAVTDPGAQAPVMAQPGAFAEAGRGLHVIQALSAAWGWTRLGGRRKAVWAALRVPEPGCGSAWPGRPA